MSYKLDGGNHDDPIDHNHHIDSDDFFGLGKKSQVGRTRRIILALTVLLALAIVGNIVLFLRKPKIDDSLPKSDLLCPTIDSKDYSESDFPVMAAVPAPFQGSFTYGYCIYRPQSKNGFYSYLYISHGLGTLDGFRGGWKCTGKWSCSFEDLQINNHPAVRLNQSVNSKPAYSYLYVLPKKGATQGIVMELVYYTTPGATAYFTDQKLAELAKRIVDSKIILS